MKVTGETVILANGGFPRKGGAAWARLQRARRIVACDGAGEVLRRRMGKEPDVTIGDLDSSVVPRGRVIRVEEQDTNDLTKAITFCRANGWTRLVILGATGRREDHSLGNIFRAMEAGIPIETDAGTFLPLTETHEGFALKLQVCRGQPISVFATEKRTRMQSQGLEWPLQGVRFNNLYCATLNRASAAEVEIISTAPAFVYLAY